MRVTQTQAHRAQLLEARRKKADAADAAKIASSGRRITRPSDDPAGARRALLVKAASEDYAIGRSKIDHAGAEHARREGALDEMTGRLTRAREVALSMANATMSASERSAAAAEIVEIKSTLVELGNTRFLDRYLFAGSATNAAAFDAAGTYQGNADEITVVLPGGVESPVTADGGALLRGTGGDQDVIGALDGLIAGLQGNNVVAIRAGLDEVAASIDHVIETRSELGADVGLLENLDAIFETAEISLEDHRAQIEEADIVEAYSAVVQTRGAYEQALQVTAKSRTPSIFDLL